MTESHFPYLVRLAPPSMEPISIDEAKAYLKIDGDERDILITRLIVTAREAAESYLQRSLLTQSWKISYDDYAPSRILLPRGPVQNIINVEMIPVSGLTSFVDKDSYRLNTAKDMLILDQPLVSYIIEVTYVAGNKLPSELPAAIRQGIYVHIGEMYEKRMEHMPLNADITSIYRPYKAVNL